jgi:UrcA family protein
MSKILFAFAALAAAASTAAPASVPRPAGTRIVSYADLDLSAAAGRGRLESRIHAAARALCGSAAPGDLGTASAVRACRVETLAQVVRPGAGGTR